MLPITTKATEHKRPERMRNNRTRRSSIHWDSKRMALPCTPARHRCANNSNTSKIRSPVIQVSRKGTSPSTARAPPGSNSWGSQQWSRPERWGLRHPWTIENVSYHQIVELWQLWNLPKLSRQVCQAPGQRQIIVHLLGQAKVAQLEGACSHFEAAMSWHIWREHNGNLHCNWHGKRWWRLGFRTATRDEEVLWLQVTVKNEPGIMVALLFIGHWGTSSQVGW